MWRRQNVLLRLFRVYTVAQLHLSLIFNYLIFDRFLHKSFYKTKNQKYSCIITIQTKIQNISTTNLTQKRLIRVIYSGSVNLTSFRYFQKKRSRHVSLDSSEFRRTSYLKRFRTRTTFPILFPGRPHYVPKDSRANPFKTRASSRRSYRPTTRAC